MAHRGLPAGGSYSFVCVLAWVGGPVLGHLGLGFVGDSGLTRYRALEHGVSPPHCGKEVGRQTLRKPKGTRGTYLTASAMLRNLFSPEVAQSRLACWQFKHGRRMSHLMRISLHQSQARRTWLRLGRFTVAMGRFGLPSCWTGASGRELWKVVNMALMSPTLGCLIVCPRIPLWPELQTSWSISIAGSNSVKELYAGRSSYIIHKYG